MGWSALLSSTQYGALSATDSRSDPSRNSTVARVSALRNNCDCVWVSLALASENGTAIPTISMNEGQIVS